MKVNYNEMCVAVLEIANNVSGLTFEINNGKITGTEYNKESENYAENVK